jgi:hypothetical protein
VWDAVQPSDDVRRVDLDDTTVEYELRRSADATRPRIDVDVHGVTVVLPDDSRVRADEILREKADWVLEKHHECERYRERVPDRTFEPGESFPVLGTERELVVEPARRNELTDEAIRLRRSAVEQSSVKRALESFYRSLARDRVTERRTTTPRRWASSTGESRCGTRRRSGGLFEYRDARAELAAPAGAAGDLGVRRRPRTRTPPGDAPRRGVLGDRRGVRPRL